MDFCANKDKDSILDYGFDWGKFYLAPTDAIVSSTWENSGDHDLTIVSDSISPDARKTSVIVSGGTNGTYYKITNRIALNDGVRQVERTITIFVSER